MPLPTLSKTWQASVNNALAVKGTIAGDFRACLRLIKNAMVGFGTNAWAVDYSCDSTTAGTKGDNVDRWSADSKLVWTGASGAHSWIVFPQPGINTGFQLCIDCRSSGFSQIESGLEMWYSPSAGFTGGTTSARPTATDEMQIHLSAGGNTWCRPGGTSDTQTLQINIFQSTDGQCTRVLIDNNTFFTTFWFFDRIAQPVDGWATPIICGFFNKPNTIDVNSADLSGGVGGGNPYIFSNVGTTRISIKFTSEGIIVSSTGNLVGQINRANDLSGDWPMMPVGIVSETSGGRGRHGVLQDLWWVPASGINTGDTFPNDTTRQFVVFGDLAHYWDGSVPAVS